MLNQVKTDPNSTNAYQIARTTFTKTLQTDSPSSDDVENLKAAAKQVRQPLAMIDALHLVALGEFAADRYDDAAAYLLTAIEVAEQHGNDNRAAELWLMASINSARSVGQSVESASAWKNAIEKHCSAQSSTSRALNVAFWQRAHEHQPANSSWPESTKQALLPLAQPIGCEFSMASPAGLFVWSAVGRAQLENGEPQLALVNFKKAETFATGDDIMWLRIAQSECLSALGQSRAATTLLCGPLASKHPVIPLAASAALGSAKLQAGTFQQGAQLLATALNATPEIDWPTKSEAEADLALALLIISETDRGLESLHAAQETFESQGNISSLLQSLENEKRLMEHEGKTDRAEGIRLRIRQIENSHTTAPNG